MVLFSHFFAGLIVMMKYPTTSQWSVQSHFICQTSDELRTEAECIVGMFSSGNAILSIISSDDMKFSVESSENLGAFDVFPDT